MNCCTCRVCNEINEFMNPNRKVHREQKYISSPFYNIAHVTPGTENLVGFRLGRLNERKMKKMSKVNW